MKIEVNFPLAFEVVSCLVLALSHSSAGLLISGDISAVTAARRVGLVWRGVVAISAVAACMARLFVLETRRLGSSLLVLELSADRAHYRSATCPVSLESASYASRVSVSASPGNTEQQCKESMHKPVSGFASLHALVTISHILSMHDA